MRRLGAGLPKTTAKRTTRNRGGDAMKGRIAELTKFNEDFEVREYPVPEVEREAVLVKVTRAGLCGSDLHIWRGELRELFGIPDRGQAFGHEMCGVVERLGRNVKTDSTGQPLAEGDRVTSCYFYPCGRCPACLDGVRATCPNKRRGTRNADDPPHFVGSYAEYYYLRPGHFVCKKTSFVPRREATWTWWNQPCEEVPHGNPACRVLATDR
jgi:D-arabinose 1-dehydrogenase-like Zn-dependent alcohol dehydrogenase